jgi:NCS2 family nucleobase:cation symporter-2
MIGVILLPVGFAYAGGGFGAADFGAARHLWLALLVFVITLGLHQFARGFLSEIAVLVGSLVGYVAAIPLGLVDFANIGNAGWVQVPTPFAIGFEFVPAAVLGITLMAIVTCAESIGDIAGTAIGGADREPTDKELSGGVMADGLASSFAAIFNAFPQISFSQNVGLVAFTGVASRYVVAIGGAFLLIAGLVPKLGAVVSTIPNAVLGGAVIIMFGLITSAGMKMLHAVTFDKRNMIIIGVSLAVAIGLRAQPALYEGAPWGLEPILHSGLIPGAVVSIVLNLILPQREVDQA